MIVNKELSVCQHLTFNPTPFPKIMAFWLANNSTRRCFKLTRTKTTALTPMANAEFQYLSLNKNILVYNRRFFWLFSLKTTNNNDLKKFKKVFMHLIRNCFPFAL